MTLTPEYILLVWDTILLCIICGWLSRTYKLLVEVFEEEEEEEMPKNNIVEFVWEDSEWNWLYRIK
jgi:hypothetical protein